MSAEAVSDDGSVVLGHTVHYGENRDWWQAAVWTENGRVGELAVAAGTALVRGPT